MKNQIPYATLTASYVLCGLIVGHYVQDMPSLIMLSLILIPLAAVTAAICRSDV